MKCRRMAVRMHRGWHGAVHPHRQVPAECPRASSDPPETLGENDALGAIEGERMHIGNVDRHVGDCLAPAMRLNLLARWLRGRPVQGRGRPSDRAGGRSRHPSEVLVISDPVLAEPVGGGSAGSR